MLFEELWRIRRREYKFERALGDCDPMHKATINFLILNSSDRNSKANSNTSEARLN